MLFKSNDALLNMVNMSNILKRLPDDFLSDLCISHLHLLTSRYGRYYSASDSYGSPHPSQSPAVHQEGHWHSTASWSTNAIASNSLHHTWIHMGSFIPNIIRFNCKQRVCHIHYTQEKKSCLHQSLLQATWKLDSRVCHQSELCSQMQSSAEFCSSSQYSSEKVKVAVVVKESLSN